MAELTQEQQAAINRAVGIMQGAKSISYKDPKEKWEDSRKEILDCYEIDESSKGLKIKDAAIKDGLNNALLGLGKDNKPGEYDSRTFDYTTLDFMLWIVLYNNEWVFKRAIDKPAQDEVRCGITLQNDSNDNEKVISALKAMRTDFIRLLQWGALFGGSVMCLMFDSVKNDDQYKEPLTEEIIKSSKIIKPYITDRWYGLQWSDETVQDMDDPDFGKPEYYTITFTNGKQIKFHHSYVIRYEHRDAPNLIKSGMLQGWGYAEGAHILEEITRDERVKETIQPLLNKCLLEIVKMPGMTALFLGEEQEQMQKRLEMITWARNINSLTFLDKEDEYQSIELTQGFSALSQLLETNMWLISAALEMQGVLYGDLKQGFSNDTAALERYDETINNRCEAYLRPVYAKMLRILFIKYGIKGEPEFIFNSLLVRKTNDDTMQSLERFANLAEKFMDMGILDATDVAEALQNYTTRNVVDFKITQDKIDRIKQRAAEESEAFNIETEEVEQK